MHVSPGSGGGPPPGRRRRRKENPEEATTGKPWVLLIEKSNTYASRRCYI